MRRVSPFFLRPAVLVGFAALSAVPVALAGCQDTYSSNSERDTHMGDIRAASPPPPASTTAPAAAPMAPAAPAAAPAAAAPAAPSASH